MQSMIRFISILCLSLCLSSCSTISTWRDTALLKAGYTQKVKAETILEQTKKEYEQKLAAKDADISLKTNEFIKGFKDNEQFAADRLYGADFAYSLNLKPDRTHSVMDNKINEARVVLPPPSVAAMAKENEDVKKQLNETLTSLQDLQKAHDEALVEAKLTSDKAKAAETELAKAKQDKIDLAQQKTKALDDAQIKLDQANNKVIAGEHARGDDAKAIQASKEKLSWGAGILAALCIAGALWSPVMKDKFAIGAGVFGVAAVGIWYLTPIVVLSIVGGLGIVLVVWIVSQHSRDNKAAVSTYSALQEIKTKSKDLWDKDIAPTLESWQTKYVKGADGKITTIPDPTIAAHIDQTLTQTNQK